MKFRTRSLSILVFSATAALAALAVHAADEPPADPDPTLAADQARAVTKAVKQNVKVAVDATKEGVQQVAEKAKGVAHEVAAATKEGAEEVAATAKRGTEKTKAVLNDSKPVKPADKPVEKPVDKPVTASP